MIRFGTATRFSTASMAALALTAVICSAARAQNGIVAQWDFENIVHPQPAGASYGPIAASAGTGSASGTHASSATAWGNAGASIAGNGSAQSFSSNTWAVGDYYQFQTSTLGLSNIGIQFDQISS